jgi:hypothetical protein
MGFEPNTGRRLEPFATENPGQILGSEQVLTSFLPPLPFCLIHRTCRHDQMDMRMVIQPAAVGVQHRMGTASPFQPWISAGKGLDGLPGCLQQQIIGDALMLPEQLTQLTGHGEGHQVIVDWQQFGALSFQPLLAFMMLAMGATPMTTGMG